LLETDRSTEGGDGIEERETGRTDRRRREDRLNATAVAVPRPFPLLPVFAPAMTRCECAGVAFAEIARRLASGGRSLEAVLAETCVGQMCTACVPDLRAFLADFGASPD
jgi:bacterioferritin-associated ferredoxin